MRVAGVHVVSCSAELSGKKNCLCLRLAAMNCRTIHSQLNIHGIVGKKAVESEIAGVNGLFIKNAFTTQ